MSRDESFLRQLKEFQPEAFESLVAEYEGPLYRFFYFDHRDHHLAQEQSAETFAQFVSSLHRFCGKPDQLGAFVFGIARNILRRDWRTRSRRPSSIDVAARLMDSQPSPNQQVTDDEQAELIMQAIQKLEQPLKSVILLRFIEDLSIGEIAEALEMPEGTVKSYIHRGRIKLKDSLKPEDHQL